jgi:hypothetical protein
MNIRFSTSQMVYKFYRKLWFLLYARLEKKDLEAVLST